jgi:hypothetical protein
MIIPLLLAGLLLIFVYALNQRRRSPFAAMAIAVLSLTGAVLVLMPETANQVAHTAGVGRGADLMLYLFVLITLAVLFNVHLRLRAAADTMTDLARAVALLEPKAPPH